MKILTRSRSLTLLIALMAIPVSAMAVPVVINDSGDSGESGDYEVTGNTDASSPGQVMEVLGGPSGTLPPGGGPVAVESETRTTDMGDLWTTLDDGGLTDATILGFGFGLNETGATGTNSLLIELLQMSFERVGGGTDVFNLGVDGVEVWNYLQGAASFEAIFLVDLGFNFMTEYNAGSTEEFTISSSISGHDDGFEIYALASAFSGGEPPCQVDCEPPCQVDCEPPGVPEPGTLALLGLGLVGMGLARRRRRS